MKAIEFDGYNIIFAEEQEEYLSLPAHKSIDGCVSTCWKLSFSDKLRILFTGKIYLQVLTFNKPLQPLKLAVKRPW